MVPSALKDKEKPNRSLRYSPSIFSPSLVQVFEIFLKTLTTPYGNNY